jgi:hypothetical protein
MRPGFVLLFVFSLAAASAQSLYTAAVTTDSGTTWTARGFTAAVNAIAVDP